MLGLDSRKTIIGCLSSVFQHQEIGYCIILCFWSGLHLQIHPARFFTFMENLELVSCPYLNHLVILFSFSP